MDDETPMDFWCRVSQFPGLTWEDLEKIHQIMTHQPLLSGQQLTTEDVGLLLGWLMLGGYTILPVGKP